MVQLTGMMAYALILIKKTDLIFNLTDTDLTVGIVNNVQLNVDSNYLPGGALTDETPLDIIIKYNDFEIPVNYDENLNDYVFDLDLTDKIDNKPIDLTLKVYESKYVNESVIKHNINCHYPVADNFNTFKSLVVSGSNVIELTDSIFFNEDLILPQSLYVIGHELNMDLGNHTIFIKDVNCRIDEAVFSNGNPVFVQDENSKLILNNCTFTNASISDEYKGSVISTLSSQNIVSELKGCSILNCHHSIYHHDTLIIDKCNARYNIFNETVDTDYPAFLTMYDGTCDITHSIFDIDYDTDELCTNEIDIKYAESLIALGEYTILNGFTTDKLSTDNSLPLFDNPYNNQSHIYCKYYYPAIECGVITSPIKSKEDKSVCHTILGNDWVFKNNVQVTRADSGFENDLRRITWED